MDYKHIITRLSKKREHDSQPQKEWLQDRKDPHLYSLYINAVPTHVLAVFARRNARGLTLTTIALTGEMITFTLKPGQWDFFYSTQKNK